VLRPSLFSSEARKAHGANVSDLRAPDARSPAYWLYLKRRRRRQVRVHYLIDSRVFRQLCLPGREATLAGFRASLSRQGFVDGEGRLPPLELSPMGFLAALGVDPPRFDIIPLPPETAKGSEYLAAMTTVLKLVEPKFREFSELKPDALRKRVDDLRQTTSPEALDLFDLCVTKVAARDGFHDPVVRQLAFDYLFRYPFPDHLREEVLQFFFASLFAAGESVAGMSKMRAVKTLWDRAYPRLLKAHLTLRAELQALDREMKLRSRKDFLGREVIHHAILGYETEDGFNPVTAFAPESEEKIRKRCIAYKSALRVFLDQITPDDLAKISFKIEDWKPGAVASCQEDGTFECPVGVGDLPVFAAEKKPFQPDRPAAESIPEAAATEAEGAALSLEDRP
jgi:hypothetical protein